MKYKVYFVYDVFRTDSVIMSAKSKKELSEKFFSKYPDTWCTKVEIIKTEDGQISLFE